MIKSKVYISTDKNSYVYCMSEWGNRKHIGLFGGNIDKKETPYDAIVREIAEESIFTMNVEVSPEYEIVHNKNCTIFLFQGRLISFNKKLFYKRKSIINEVLKSKGSLTEHDISKLHFLESDKFTLSRRRIKIYNEVDDIIVTDKFFRIV